MCGGRGHRCVWWPRCTGDSRGLRDPRRTGGRAPRHVDVLHISKEYRPVNGEQNTAARLSSCAQPPSQFKMELVLIAGKHRKKDNKITNNNKNKKQHNFDVLKPIGHFGNFFFYTVFFNPLNNKAYIKKRHSEKTEEKQTFDNILYTLSSHFIH